MEHTTGFKYVVTLIGRTFFEHKTVTTVAVAGDQAALAAGLRPWLLDYLGADSRDDGWYEGSLVAIDGNGYYDPYFPVAVEDVIWYWGGECHPRAELDTSPAPVASYR